MFNFPKYTVPKKTEIVQTGVPMELLARLDQLSQQLLELSYQLTEVKRTTTRLETKLSRLGIAMGHGDAVSRNPY